LSRTVIVTGGAGFIGSHVVDAALADGRKVVVIDDLSSGNPANVAPEASLEVVDLVDREVVDRIIDAAAPEAIFHLGAQSSVIVSVKDPRRDCAVNVEGTLNVLEAANRHRAPVVFTSTGGALYGNDAPLPTSEDRIPAPVAPYGASKWAAEAYILTWSRANGIPHTVCRLGNVYGPRQSPHGEAGVVSIFTYKLRVGERPMLFGRGAPTRDYVHVHDVVRAMRMAVGNPGVFNIATGIETPVSALFETLQGIAGTSIEPIPAPLREGELERSCLDPRRAAERLGWRAEIKLDEGLESTFHALMAGFSRQSQTSDPAPEGAPG
jgi:UDP-glucose 4-epimerase